MKTKARTHVKTANPLLGEPFDDCDPVPHLLVMFLRVHSLFFSKYVEQTLVR